MKFFFGLLAFIAAIVVVVLLIVSLFRTLDSQSGGKNNPISSTYNLEDESSINSVVRYTVSGPIVAEENYREVRITISQNTRTIEQINGYQGKVANTSTFSNTTAAYQAFIGALRAAEFTSRRSGETSDISATCVTGQRLKYELSVANEKPVDTWTTSCSFNHGNFAGNPTGTAQIFRAQIPNFNEFTSGIGLSGI